MRIYLESIDVAAGRRGCGHEHGGRRRKACTIAEVDGIVIGDSTGDVEQVRNWRDRAGVKTEETYCLRSCVQHCGDVSVYFAYRCHAPRLSVL